MNVYDFDNTIYRGDSTAHFVLYCYTHRPLTLLNLPSTAVLGLLYGLRIVKKMTFKRNLYRMFRYVKDMDTFIDEYVESHMKNIKQWYYDQQREDDVIISASPYFIISRFCKKLNIQYVMASPVDMYTGAVQGENCHGEEKVRRFYEVFPEGQIEEFYSDSRSDAPLARISKRAFLVNGDNRKAWDNL